MNFHGIDPETSSMTDEAINELIDHCKRKDLRCKKCRYGIKILRPDYNGGACCIFATTPNSWDKKKEG